MKRILFCKISSMKYYKGVDKLLDPPQNGGAFVQENGYGYEQYNFLPQIRPKHPEEEYCYGYVEPKSSKKGQANSFHIERIEGCESCSKDASVDTVLVIWCATRQQGDVTVVGWYRDAEVYRNVQKYRLEKDGEERDALYNVVAKAENCVLLPENERNRNIWSVPSATRTNNKIGFGQAMVWYPEKEEAKVFASRLSDVIDGYSGKNDLRTFPG